MRTSVTLMVHAVLDEEDESLTQDALDELIESLEAQGFSVSLTDEHNVDDPEISEDDVDDDDEEEEFNENDINHQYEDNDN